MLARKFRLPLDLPEINGKKEHHDWWIFAQNQCGQTFNFNLVAMASLVASNDSSGSSNAAATAILNNTTFGY